ncbi:MAG: hypothetical protein HOQ24_18035, partial [Mycobacteriaceae bacterium]|nr:hypothetical protein [Mycobacteriaceae bacterium]
MIAGLALVMLTVAAPSGPQAPPPAGLEQTLQSGLGALFPGGHSTPFTTTAPTPPTLFWQNWSSGSSTQTTTAPHPFRAATPPAAGGDTRNR